MFKFYCLTLGTESPSGITWDLSLKEYFWEYDLDANPIYIEGNPFDKSSHVNMESVVGKIVKFEIVDNQVWCYVKPIGGKIKLSDIVEYARINLSCIVSDYKVTSDLDATKRHVNSIEMIRGGFIEPIDDIYKGFIDKNIV